MVSVETPHPPYQAHAPHARAMAPKEVVLRANVPVGGETETAARAEGFTRAELGATAGGEPLYGACGYQEIERMAVPTPGGVTVPITRMGKLL